MDQNTKPIYLDEDWDSGIGGGLWSTGLALAKYFDTPHAAHQLLQNNKKLRVLELGSGNGFLSVCLMAVCNNNLEHVVITDTKEHLPLIERTLEANAGIVDRKQVSVQEYLWGTKPDDPVSYDLIIGSDLAYRDELHDPLIASILDFSSSNTVTLLGVTMNDTRPIFFHKLGQAGLEYERLADHSLDLSFRGTNFGIFVIRRRQDETED
jgi:predicted nicotinamide N-methyase